MRQEPVIAARDQDGAIVEFDAVRPPSRAPHVANVGRDQMAVPRSADGPEDAIADGDVVEPARLAVRQGDPRIWAKAVRAPVLAPAVGVASRTTRVRSGAPSPVASSKSSSSPSHVTSRWVKRWTGSIAAPRPRGLGRAMP
jgi:hypothetical protein